MVETFFAGVPNIDIFFSNIYKKLTLYQEVRQCSKSL